jgi:hypothetical protein
MDYFNKKVNFELTVQEANLAASTLMKVALNAKSTKSGFSQKLDKICEKILDCASEDPAIEPTMYCGSQLTQFDRELINFMLKHGLQEVSAIDYSAGPGKEFSKTVIISSKLIQISWYNGSVLQEVIYVDRASGKIIDKN